MSLLTKLNNKLKSGNKLYWVLREWFVVSYSTLARVKDKRAPNKKTRLLFYHINSLGFAGTEKFLQVIAKYINKEKYTVFYMYPNRLEENPQTRIRLEYINSGGAIGIPFDYTKKEEYPPYFVSGMNPDLKKIISSFNIDLMIVADSGNANYPFSIIKNIPIILLNIFGQPNVQKNIKFHICTSEEVAKKLRPIVPEKKIKVYPVPSEGPLFNSKDAGDSLRACLNIAEEDIVFGRIGRADDNIHDPIGIEAFKKALNTRKDIHYVIMAPPPILKKQVQLEKIPNVHFLDSSSSEADVWAFHAAIDALAHFRNDGESFGLNIAEAMLSGKPIITHKSHIWNAHLEYLDPSFSRVANKGDSDSYAKFMLEFAEKKASGELSKMGKIAKDKAEKEFMATNIIPEFEDWIDIAVK